MLGKNIQKYAVLVLSILLADLISLYALNILDRSRSVVNPYRSAAITMAVVVLIFYPTLTFIDSYLVKLSGKLMKKSARYAGNKLIGQLLGFVLAIILLWLGYTHALYHRDIAHDASIESKSYWQHLLQGCQ